MYPFRRRPVGALELGPGSARSETRLRIGAHSQRPQARSSTRYDRMRAVLLDYLSPILVDSVLDRALQRRKFSRSMLDDTALSEVTADIMVGLRLFVPESKLSQLMLELAEILDEGQP